MENIFLSLEKEVFRGNILDITYDSQGIIYNVNKYYDNFMEIDYLENENCMNEEKFKSYYDSCILFFSLRKYSSKDRKKLFKQIHEHTNKMGYIYIWEIRKDLFKSYNKKINVALPDKSIVKFPISDMNLFEECTPEKVIESMQEYFEVIENINSKDCFKIVGKRKDV